MEPRPPGSSNPDICYGDWGCIEEEQQWLKDHPNGEISEEEQRSMDQYAWESSYWERGLSPPDEDDPRDGHIRGNDPDAD